MVAVTVQKPPAHFGMELPVTRPLVLTVQLPTGVQVVAVPQQPVLQSAVLASLKDAVAFNWTVASSLMVAETGATVTLETVSVLLTVALSAGLLMPLLVAVTVPEPFTHLVTALPVKRPVPLTVTPPVAPHVVACPAQVVVQSTVLLSLMRPTARICWFAPSLTVTGLGVTAKLTKVTTVLTVIVEVSECPLLVPVAIVAPAATP